MTAGRSERVAGSAVAGPAGLPPVGRLLCVLGLVVWGCTPLNGPKTVGDASVDGDSAEAVSDAADGADATLDMNLDSRPGVDVAVDGPSPPDAAGDVRADVAADVPTGADAPVDVSTDTPADVVGCARYTIGPKMVAVPSGCIDSTEVTQAQYREFVVAKNGVTTGQAVECMWNTVYAPAAPCALDPTLYPDHPVYGVDWCDATAYCRWAGKRLCGRVGGGGLIVTDNMNFPPDLGNAGVSEWMAACSHGGDHVFPYGDSQVAESCNGTERSGPDAIVAVKSTTGCQGGYAGIYDMAGNVHEWEDACLPLDPLMAPGPNDRCFIRGGSYHDTGDSCPMAYDLPRNWVDSWCDMGFRCCANP